MWKDIKTWWKQLRCYHIDTTDKSNPNEYADIFLFAKVYRETCNECGKDLIYTGAPISSK